MRTTTDGCVGRRRCAVTFNLSMRTFFYCVIVLWVTFSPAFGQATVATKIVAAARNQIGTTVLYDPSYQALKYPNGDVDGDRGVCTDVVIRALRSALSMDLQQLVYEDMRTNFRRYPQKWGQRGPDRNIDHRRVPNLQVFFTRKGYELPVTNDPSDYIAGDLVTCTVPPDLPHIMVVSDRTGPSGHPLVIHNIGAGAQEEDRLFEFELTGHYRLSVIEPSGAPNHGRDQDR